MKKTKIALMMLMLGNLCFAKDFFVGIAPSYKLENGTIYETRNRESTNSKYYEIEWQDKLNSKLGFDIFGGWKIIQLDFGMDFAIPKESGESYYSFWNKKADPSYRTDYTKSKNTLASSFDIDTGLKFNIPVEINENVKINVNPYGRFYYELTKYEASDTESTSYAAGGKSSVVSTTVTPGTTMTYNREIFDVTAGLEAGVTLFERFTINADVGVSPFTKVNSKNSYRATLDSMQGFFQKWTFGANFEAEIWNGFSAGLMGKYILLNKISGDTYDEVNGKYVRTEAYSSETNADRWQIGIFGKYTFRFGPTYVSEARESKAGEFKVRNGKVKVRQY